MIRIRKYRTADAEDVITLVADTFRRFNKAECTDRGQRGMLKHYSAGNVDKVRKSFRKTALFYVAAHERGIVGMIRGTPTFLFNLYVEGVHHRQGIGTRLLEKYETACLNLNSTAIKIKAAPFAVPFYQAYGYKKTTGQRFFWGLAVQPMKKTLVSE